MLFAWFEVHKKPPCNARPSLKKLLGFGPKLSAFEDAKDEVRLNYLEDKLEAESKSELLGPS